MKVRFLPRSHQDLDRLHEFLHAKNANAADRAVDLLYSSALSLRDAPEVGRPVGRGMRELIIRFGKRAYIIRYRIDESARTIFVTRIWHSRERRR